MTSSFIITAPEEEATFFSLPFIEELLYYRAQWQAGALRREGDNGTESVKPKGSDMAGIVRRQMDVERLYEMHYYDLPDRAAFTEGEGSMAVTMAEPSASPTTAAEEDPATALLMLRTGLCRALGLPGPDPRLLDEDILLHRRRCDVVHTVRGAPTPSSDDVHPVQALVNMTAENEPQPPAPAVAVDQGYLSQDAEQLQRAVMVEWFEDTLEFIVRMDFSAVQARCVLLDAMGLLECLDSLSSEATEEDIALVMTPIMQEMLSSQTCQVPTTVLDRRTRQEAVSREVPDPELVQSLEQKLQKSKLSKKQQIAIKEQIAKAPLVSVTTVQEIAMETEREVSVGPYFSLAEAASLMEHLTGSLLTHWRLFKWTLTQPQQIVSQEAVIVLEDVDAFCVPPLKEFIQLQLYTTESQRRDLWEDAQETIDDTYLETFANPTEQLKVEELDERQQLKDEKARLDRENRENALTGEEYDRVELAYCTRLRYALSGTTPQDEKVCPSLSSSTAAAAATPVVVIEAVPTPPPSRSRGSTGDRRRSSARGGGGGNKKGGALSLPPILPRLPAETIEIEADATFKADEVIARIDNVSASLDQRLVVAKPKGKGKR